MGARNPYDNFPHKHRGRSFSRDFERIDALKMDDKILVEDYKTGMVMYCYVNQLKAIDPEFGEYLKTASISEDGSTLTLTKNDGTQIVFHGGSGSAEGAVRYDTVQTLTEGQKGVARGNIGAISTSDMSAAILAETQRAQNAEAGLSNNILAEQTRAENAESALSARIDTIIQGRNVRDIVGSYAELMTYDTSTLGDNDIVMVLIDNTKSGHTTYYRWKEVENEWEFIGGLAFTYTKTEIDDKFAALHIVLPTIPMDAVEHPEDYQELLAQVDSVVRSAGADASFKMPVTVADSVVGDVNVTFVKRNPTYLFLGIFADESSTLYTIHRTMGTPKTYDVQIMEKVFATMSDINVFVAEYGVTTIDEIIDAWNAGKAIICIKNTGTPNNGVGTLVDIGTQNKYARFTFTHAYSISSVSFQCSTTGWIYTTNADTPNIRTSLPSNNIPDDNTIYNLGGVATLVIAGVPSSNVRGIVINFHSSILGTQCTFPATSKWNQQELPIIAENKDYQITILDGVFAIAEITTINQ